MHKLLKCYITRSFSAISLCTEILRGQRSNEVLDYGRQVERFFSALRERSGAARTDLHNRKPRGFRVSPQAYSRNS